MAAVAVALMLGANRLSARELASPAAQPTIVSVRADRAGFTVTLNLPGDGWSPTRAEEIGWLVGVPGDGAGGPGAEVTAVEVTARNNAPLGTDPRSGQAIPIGVRLDYVGYFRDQAVARLVIGYRDSYEGIGRFPLSVTVRVDYRASWISSGRSPSRPPPPDPSGAPDPTMKTGPLAGEEPDSASRKGAAGPSVDHSVGDPFSYALGALLNSTALPRSFPPRAQVDGQLRGQRAARQATVAADPRALKLHVSSDGPVSVTGAQMSEAGWDLAGVLPESTSVSVGGDDLPVVLVGIGDGRFDPGDRIVFDGRAMKGPFTRANVYWLTQVGSGARVASIDATPSEAAAAAAYRETAHYEQDSSYLVSLRAGETDDRWLWGHSLSATKPVFTTTFGLANLSLPAGPSRIRMRLLGYAHDSTVSPDHRVRLSINGAIAAEFEFDGRGARILDADLDAGLLERDANVLELRGLRSGAEFDSVYVDWFDLTYDAAYTAAGDVASVGAPGEGTFAFALDGFSSPDIVTLDVTDPARQKVLSGAAVERTDLAYGVRFTLPVTAGTRLRAFSLEAAKAPVQITRNAPSDWRDSRHGADMVIVTHRSFAADVEPLAERHRRDGMRVAVALVDDVYDEFSAGVFDPRAIRAFVSRAFHSWSGARPTYVLLVGEANLDYRRAYDTGPENFVPSLRFDTTSDLTGEMGEATSDLLYASVAGEDVLPDVLLGRISVGDSDEARTVIGKSLRYMDAARREAWQRDVVLVADDDAAAFESFSEQLALKIPAPGTVRRFYAASYPRDRDLSSDINSAIDEGALAINFTGHGNVALWSPWPGGGRIYENADIGRLDNGPRMALFTSATCMNGWFDHPFVPVSMAEKWLRHPNGGGVSAWTPSGMVALSGPNVLLSAVFDGLFDARGVPMGALTARATARAYAVSPEWRDVIRMFVLFGDPSLVVSGGPQTPPGRVHLPRIATSIGR